MRATVEQVRSLRANLKEIIAPRRDEIAFIVYDETTQDVFETFTAALEIDGVEVHGYELPAKRPITEIPGDLLELLDELKPTLCFNQLFGYPEETHLRIALFGIQEGLGARVGHSPDVTMDMVLGPMLADVPQMKELGNRLMMAMDGATEVEVTSPGGTQATFSLRGREPKWDLEIGTGDMGNLPAGEVWWGPVEDSMDGVLVIDGSIGDMKKIYPPLKIEVKSGRVTGMECEDTSLPELLEPLLHVDEQADLLGELGIGLNPNARITGLLLEDEKALHTVHFAFGFNTDMPGGKNTSSTHRDFIIMRPGLKRLDNGKEIMRNGEIQ